MVLENFTVGNDWERGLQPEPLHDITLFKKGDQSQFLCSKDTPGRRSKRC